MYASRTARPFFADSKHCLTISRSPMAAFQVEIQEWHVKPGQRVSEFDKVATVQSDKATVDITSRFEGTIKALHYSVGAMAKTGAPLLDIDVEMLEPDSKANTAAASTPATQEGGAATIVLEGTDADDPRGLRSLATPAVRRLARENNVTLASVRGTGKDGRVLKEDIMRFVAGPSSTSDDTMRANFKVDAGASLTTSRDSGAVATGDAAMAGPVAPQPTAVATQQQPAVAAPRPPPTSQGADVRRPLRGLQRAMVKSMTTAWMAPRKL